MASVPPPGGKKDFGQSAGDLKPFLRHKGHRNKMPIRRGGSVPVKRGFELPRRVQRLFGVHGHGRADTLVRTLEGLVVSREYVQAAGHPAGGEVRQVLTALFLLGDLPLVAVPPSVPALGTAVF